MVEMKENPKLDLPSSYDDCGSGEKIKSPEKNSASDHINADKPDSFIIDMESFMHGVPNKENNPNSRFPRSLSRKGSLRGDKKNVNNSNSTNSIANDHRDSLVSSSSSHGGTPEKLTAVAEVSGNHPGNNLQTHHQITFASGNISAASESSRLFSLRRNSFKRSSPPWMLDPKRILMFFATLSSMGTILLIYFTLSIGRTNPDGNALD